MNKLERTPESIATTVMYLDVVCATEFLETYDIFESPQELMKFSLENGYITKEKYDMWAEAFRDNVPGTDNSFYLLIGENEELDPYCITYERAGFDTLDEYERALMIYGELVVSKDEYYNKFVEVVSLEKVNKFN